MLSINPLTMLQGSTNAGHVNINFSLGDVNILTGLEGIFFPDGGTESFISQVVSNSTGVTWGTLGDDTGDFYGSDGSNFADSSNYLLSINNASSSDLSNLTVLTPNIDLPNGTTLIGKITNVYDIGILYIENQIIFNSLPNSFYVMKIQFSQSSQSIFNLWEDGQSIIQDYTSNSPMLETQLWDMITTENWIISTENELPIDEDEEESTPSPQFNNKLGSHYAILRELSSTLRSKLGNIPVYVSDKEIKNKNVNVRIFPLSQDLISHSHSSRLYEYSFEIILYYTIANVNEGDYQNYLDFSDRLENTIFNSRNNKVWFDGVLSSITINSEESANDNILTTTLSFNCKHSIN